MKTEAEAQWSTGRTGDRTSPRERAESLKVEVLGPRAGRASYLVVSGGTTILLDCGPGTLPLLEERGLTQRLDAIVISHMDYDHMLDLLPLAGLASLSALFPGVADWRKPRLFVPRDGGAETLADLSAVWYGDGSPHAASRERTNEVVSHQNRFTAAFDVVKYGEEDQLALGAMTMRFRRTRHSSTCFAPRVTDGRSTVVYSADSGYAPELAAHAEGADLFLCEATFLEHQPALTQQHEHMTGEEAGRLAAEASVGRLVLTHLGFDPQENVTNLTKAKSKFGGVVDLAQEGNIFYV